MKASGSHIAKCMGPGGLKNTQDTPAYMPQVPREWRREYTVWALPFTFYFSLVSACAL